MFLIEDVASSIWENENANKEHFFFLPSPLFFSFAKPQNVPFLLALMHLLITKFLSKHLLWIRWITHSFYRAPPPHAVYRSDCDELWNRMGGLECSFVAFQHINLGHGIDYHPTHVTLTLIDTCNPATLINYTCCMKINALFKLVNDRSVDWYVLYTAPLCFLPYEYLSLAPHFYMFCTSSGRLEVVEWA